MTTPSSATDLLAALDAHLRADLATDAVPGDNRVEYLYAIDVPACREAGELVLRLLARQRRPDGTWDRPTAALVTEEAALRTSATDRRLLGALLGARPLTASANDTASTPAVAFVLPAALAVDWIPLAARAGRLILRESAQSTSTKPLQWDDGPAWRLAIETEEDDEDFLVRGILTSSHDTLPLSGPVLVFEVGLFVTHERIAAFDPGPSAGVLRVLRQAGRFLVPSADTSKLAEWLSRYGVEGDTLPPRLRIAPVTAPPLPVLRLTAVDDETLRGEVVFEYDGTSVPEHAESPYFDEPRQRVIHRSTADEEAAEAQLITAGLSIEADIWQLSARHLASVVRELTGQGWSVEATGVRYRAPGTARVSVTSGIDWFDLTAVIPYGDTSATLGELLAALERGEQTVVLGDGSRGVLPEEWLRRYAPLTAAATRQPDGSLRFARYQIPLLDALLDDQLTTEVQVDTAYATLRERLSSAVRPAPVEPPPTFHGELRVYQQEALGWLQFLRHFGFGGCLADDMGLGKTVTVLAELARVAATDPRPSLVVVPRSVVHNWRAEAARFTPSLRVVDFSAVDRHDQGVDLRDVDLVLVTYGTVRRDIEKLRAVEFEYVILDEAQAIKNAQTEAARAVRLLTSRHRLALSGTPIENHLGELWSLFEFLNPGLLGKASKFRQATGRTRGQQPQQVDLVAKALRPFLLRRTKAQVATELPARTEQTLTCVLTPRERSFYDALRRHYRTSLLAHVSKNGIERSSLQVLEALLRLRQAACHPGLISTARQDDQSSKIELLLDCLREVISEGHKALVFSQFTSLLALVRPVLDAAKISYEYLDGRTRDRAPRIARFQEDPSVPVFLISLKAGGVGLNLTAADYVFLLDPWWNPAVEAQAIDRAHRIGQTREVFAYRLISEDTVEQKVLSLQASKRALADAVLSANPAGLAGLSTADLEFLLD